MNTFFGDYRKYNTVSKDEGGRLLGSDCIVGDFYEIVFERDGNHDVAWLQNRFGKRVAFFDGKTSHELNLYRAREWTIKAFLSFVAYTEKGEEGTYWGEAAIVCYDPSYEEAYTVFLNKLSDLMKEGIRPDLTFTPAEEEMLLLNGGDWMTEKRVDPPQKIKGTVVMKDHMSLEDKMVEQGRARNKGCYVGSILFIVVVVVLIVLFFKSCFGF